MNFKSALLCVFLTAFLGTRSEAQSQEGGAQASRPAENPGNTEGGEEAETAPAEDPPGGLDVESLRGNITREASTEIASITLGNSDVDLLVSGFWKGTLAGNLGFTRGSLGTALSTDSPFLFEQEADLTLSLWVRNRWFVEANFLDDYSMNTYRAGYQGLPGEAVQYVGIGNTGLDFPVFPYMDLGGNSPNSFGIYGRFGAGDFTVHSLFRYDAAAREERVFVGDRERTYSYIGLETPVHGRFFVLPDDNLDVPPGVYIEDVNGDLRDQNNRRWRRALSTEYAAGASSGIVELGLSPAGMVAAAYTKGGNSAPWGSSMGNYATPASSGFLGEAQAWFGAGIVLENYPQPGDSASSPAGRPGTVTFNNGVTALVIYEKGTFSPFERQSRYQAPSSSSTGASLVRLSNRERVAGYDIVSMEENTVSADVPLYASQEIRRGLYELVGIVQGRRDPGTRWPMGNQYPEIYLPGSYRFNGDMGLRFTSYGSSGSGSFALGTDVVYGSVQVYRSGLPDTDFSYDESSGTVTLGNPPLHNEVIRISYLRRSNERRHGSIAAGVGMVYDPGRVWSSELAIGLRWNLSGESYSEEDASSPGTVGISAASNWNYDRLTSRITAGFSFEQPDTTGMYRAAGMEGNEIVLYMPAENSFNAWPPSTLSLARRAPLVYRNYQDKSIFGNLMQITWSGSSVIADRDAPYPALDSKFGSQTQVLVAEFSLDSGRNWAGFEVPLGSEKEILEQAGEIEIPFRFHGFSSLPAAGQIELAIQFGALSGKDYGIAENNNLIVTIPLFTAASVFDENARIVSYRLTDSDRRKLEGADHMRLLVTYSGTAAMPGRVLLAPPIVRGAAWRPVIESAGAILPAPGGIADAAEWLETGAGRLEDKYGEIIGKLHPEGIRQRVLKLDLDLSGSIRTAGADGRVPSLPLSEYESVSFFVRAERFSPPLEKLRFILAGGPELRYSDITIDAEIPLLPYFSPGEWHKVQIQYRGGGQQVTIDGYPAAGALVRYRPPPPSQASSRAGDTAGGRSRYAAVLVTGSGTGTVFLDEIILEDPSPAYRFNGGNVTEWHYPETILSAGGKKILENLSVRTALEGALRGDPFTSADELDAGAMNRSNAAITFLGADLEGNFAFSAVEKNLFWSAGHSVSRNWGPLYAGENFSLSPRDDAANHRFNLRLAGPFSAAMEGEADYDTERLVRRWNGSTGLAFSAKFIPVFSANTIATWTENTPEPSSWLDSYGRTWTESWKRLLPDSGRGAARRDTRTTFRLAEETSPVGADLSLEGSTSFSAPNTTLLSAHNVRFDIPLVFPSFSVVFRGERGFRRQLDYADDNIFSDGRKFAESIRDSLPLWKVPPFYSLFTPSLERTMEKGLAASPSKSSAEYTSFNDRAGFTLTLPEKYDISSLYIPAGFDFQIGRTLEQKFDVPMDLLNVGGSLAFASINLFGAMGSAPLFTFYSGDELNHSIAVSTAFPRGQTPSWRVQSSLGLNFQGFAGASLGAANTLTLGSSGWIESVEANWTVPTRHSLLSLFYDFIARLVRTQSSWLTVSEFLDSEYEQYRKETLEVALDNSGDALAWSFSLGHESFVRMTGRLTFSVFAKISLAENTGTENFSFLGTIGTTLNVSF
ncbi:MAG: hypothetical protein LBI86_05590 [Treponema sp.]|jgi:hypothetical protein|nr:hypothetical protein [Treponema sp.]